MLQFHKREFATHHYDQYWQKRKRRIRGERSLTLFSARDLTRMELPLRMDKLSEVVTLCLTSALHFLHIYYKDSNTFNLINKRPFRSLNFAFSMVMGDELYCR